MMKNVLSSISTVTLLLVVAIATPGLAAEIGFVVNADINSGASPTYNAASAGGGVAMAPDTGTFWNSVVPVDSTAHALPKASDGTTLPGPAITVTFSGFTAHVDFADPNTTPSPDLMNEIVYGFSNTVSFTISNLPTSPNTTYDLYLYSQNGPFKSATTVFTIGAQALTATNVNVSSFEQDINFVMFGGLKPSLSGAISGTFVQHPDTASGSSLNGFQLVQVVPEPGSVGLLTAGGLLVLRRRRA